MPNSFDRYDVLGIPVSATTLDQASNLIHSWARDRLSRVVLIRDVHGIMQAQDDEELFRLHLKADLVTPDGMPLVWLGKLAGKTVARTCGPDLIERLMSDSAVSGLRHYFYGGKPGVAESLRHSFVTRWPTLKVVGTGTPPFRPLEEVELRSVTDDINRSGADVVWIGISTPKQEYLMRDMAPLVGATLIGVGAAFDFHTGEVRRAPRWMREAGLEWSWRLAVEPRRLWRRYLIKAPRFVGAILLRKTGLSRPKPKTDPRPTK